MLILFIGDILSYYLALFSAYFTRDFLDVFVHIPFHFSLFYLVTEYFWIPAILVIVITSKGLYSLRKPFWHEVRRILFAVFITFLFVFTIVSLGKLSEYISRLFLILLFSYTLLYLIIIRFTLKSKILNKRAFAESLVVVGAANHIDKICNNLYMENGLCFYIKGIVLTNREEYTGKYKMLGYFDDLEEVPLYRDGKGLLFYANGLTSLTSLTYSSQASGYIMGHRINNYARKACYNIRPAVLVTGGLFDSEDCYGAWHTYKAIKTQSPETELYLAFGPWWHGAWTRRSFEGFGNIYFGESTSAYYKDHIEYPFFRYYLEGKGEKPSHRVSVFHTGANRWEFMDEWPAPSVSPTPFYLHEGGKVSTMAPTETSSYSEYISDMEHPVPFTANPVTYRTLEFMVDDQRFASSRPDVLTFVSPILEDTLTLAGPIEVQLQTAISSTDADFMVKVIDVFPANYKYPEEATSYLKNSHYPMGGYQLMVRGELFRGRYRESFEYPKAFVPNERTEVSYTLPDVAHVFLPGHRLMIQVQSSWFPIIDRNPQRFIDTYTCTTEDFEMQQRIRIYHQADAPSRVILPVVKQ